MEPYRALCAALDEAQAGEFSEKRFEELKRVVFYSAVMMPAQKKADAIRRLGVALGGVPRRFRSVITAALSLLKPPHDVSATSHLAGHLLGVSVRGEPILEPRLKHAGQ